MKFKIKKYKYYKIKKYFKKSSIFFIYNGTNVKNSVKIDQQIKKLNLQYYKLYNKITNKVFFESVFKNFRYTINGLLFLIKIKNNSFGVCFQNLLLLDKSLKLVLLKMNNNLFNISKLNYKFLLNYRNTNLLFLKTLKSYFKNVLKLTNKVSK